MRFVKSAILRTELLLALTAPFCAAQTIEVESLFQQAPPSGMWKHHTGDDPRRADPAFDDSAWFRQNDDITVVTVRRNS